jgi:hypothetical protein
MKSLRSTLLGMALIGAAALPAHAQMPIPADLPWNSPPSMVRVRLARLGLHEAGGATGVGRDSTLVFSTPVAGGTARLTTRFRAKHLWHASLSVQGDSATVQSFLDRYTAAVSARHGQPRAGQPRSRWVLRDGRAFTLPRAPTRLENGTFGFAVSFHGR